MTRFVVDRDCCLRLDPAGGAQILEPLSAVVAAARAGRVAVAFTAVDLEEAGPAEDLDVLGEGAGIAVRDRGACWRLDPEAARLAERLGPEAVLTAYPVACRAGLRARGALPGGPWILIERAGEALWLCGGRGGTLVQWRRLPADVDLGEEVARSIRAWRQVPDPASVAVLAVGEALAEQLAAAGFSARPLPGPSPAFDGLGEVPERLRFLLPDTLAELEAARRERRARRQRLVALGVALLAVGAAAMVEARLWAATARGQALAALVDTARARRDDAVAARVGAAGRALNASLLEMVGRAYERLASAPGTCEFAYQDGRWTAACRARSWSEGVQLAWRFGADAPSPVFSGAERGWEVAATRHVPGWIGSLLR